MQIKKFLCILCAFVISAGCLGVNAGAIQLPDREVSMVIERASGRFSMDVYAHEVVSANTSFPLEAGETVTINATYSPLTASVDFGLIAPDGFVLFREWDEWEHKQVHSSERAWLLYADSKKQF